MTRWCFRACRSRCRSTWAATIAVLLVPQARQHYAQRRGRRGGVRARATCRPRACRVADGRSIARFPAAPAADADGVLRVDFEARPDHAPAASLTRELEREYRAVVDEILELRGDDGRIRAFVRSITDAGALADTAGYSPDLNFSQKLQLLETFDVVERLKLALQLQRERLAELQVRKRIHDDVEDGAQKQQREYFLRRQMDAIRKELGENDGSVADEYRQKIASAGMPDAGAAAGRTRVGPSRADGRLERRVGHDPDLSRLAPGGPVGEAVRRAPRPGARARGAGRRPRRPRRCETAHHRVPGGPQAAHRAGHDGEPPFGRHPHA